MTDKTIVFIGGGNMAVALINGLIADGTDPRSILVAEPDSMRREEIAARLGVRTREDNEGAAREADILLLAVKPQVIGSVCQQLSAIARQRQPLVISIAAGIRHADLQRWLGYNVAIARTMPNTPAMIQAGASVLFGGANLTDEQKDNAERILRAVGLAIWVEDESMMDAVTAVSGSGPAYFFLFLEAMEQAAMELGLPQQTAHLLTLQTALGAARMAIESKDDPATLRERVTSPGGTTEQAIKSFESNNIRQLFLEALTAARDKSIELSEILGDTNDR